MHAICFYFSISFFLIKHHSGFIICSHSTVLNSPLSRVTATLRTEKERPTVAELYRATIWLSWNGFNELQVDVLKIKSENVYCPTVLFFFFFFLRLFVYLLTCKRLEAVFSVLEKRRRWKKWHLSPDTVTRAPLSRVKGGIGKCWCPR